MRLADVSTSLFGLDDLACIAGNLRVLIDAAVAKAAFDIAARGDGQVDAPFSILACPEAGVLSKNVFLIDCHKTSQRQRIRVNTRRVRLALN